MMAEIEHGITYRRRIEIIYKPRLRLVEPHVFGRSSSGHLLLRGYQLKGASASGEHEHWKLFRVDKITSISITEQTFDGPRPGYNPYDKAMKRSIIARL